VDFAQRACGHSIDIEARFSSRQSLARATTPTGMPGAGVSVLTHSYNYVSQDLALASTYPSAANEGDAVALIAGLSLWRRRELRNHLRGHFHDAEP